MPQSTVLDALGKVSGVVSKKNLSSQIENKDHKKSCVYRCLKTPKIPIKSNFDSQKGKKNTDPQMSLKGKTQLFTTNREDLSPMAAESLRTSVISADERRIQNILVTLREKDFADIEPHRCAFLHFREKHFAEHKLRNMKKASASFKRYLFTHLSLKQQAKKEDHIKKDKEKWEEITRLNEQRHFHLNRVMKYLSK